MKREEELMAKTEILLNSPRSQSKSELSNLNDGERKQVDHCQLTQPPAASTRYHSPFTLLSFVLPSFVLPSVTLPSFTLPELATDRTHSEREALNALL